MVPLENSRKDGIHGMLPRERMCEGAKKYWDFYNMVPGAGFYQKEFGYYSLEKWQREEGLDPSRPIGFQVDTDGLCDPVIDLYRSLGMTHMSPFEVAAGCDVIRTAEKYPDLKISGGVDKRVLAQGPKAIDEMIDRIFPVMQQRGGFLPTCDHGVPEEVSLENYLYYRKRCLEFA